MDAVIVKKSDIHGKGLHAAIPFRNGELICVVTRLNQQWRNNEYGNSTNHSDTPTAKESQWYNEIRLHALRDIKVGEEITINYNLWSVKSIKIQPFIK